MNTMTMDPYGNSKLIIPRSNSTSDLFNVENFIPSCTMNNTNNNMSTTSSNSHNNVRRNYSINYNNIINTNNNNNLYTNGQTLRRSNTTITRDSNNNNITIVRNNSTRITNNNNNNNNNNNTDHRMRQQQQQQQQHHHQQINNNNIVQSKNSNDLHKYVVNNNMVRRSNTLNPNIQQQQQQPNYVKRSNTQNYGNNNNNNNNYSHIFNVNMNNNNPRRNKTINVSSSTGQRKYSKINTFKNFEQYYNHKHNTRVKDLSPLQIQRNKMKSEFVFPNGEHFTPRKVEKSFSPIPPPTPAITPTSNNYTTSTTTNITTSSYNTNTNSEQSLKRSNSKKFGSFWKKIIGKESKEKELPKIQITQTPSISVSKPIQPPVQTIQTPPSPPHEPIHLGDDSTFPMLSEISSTDQQDFDSSRLIDRLQNQWEIIHQDIPISQIVQDSIIDSYMPKSKVSFGNEIFVNETYSAEEYDRADPEEIIPVKDRKLVFDNEFGFIDEVKYEVNQYKRNEMMIHMDSIKFVQFCK